MAVGGPIMARVSIGCADCKLPQIAGDTVYEHTYVDVYDERYLLCWEDEGLDGEERREMANARWYPVSLSLSRPLPNLADCESQPLACL